MSKLGNAGWIVGASAAVVLAVMAVIRPPSAPSTVPAPSPAVDSASAPPATAPPVEVLRWTRRREQLAGAALADLPATNPWIGNSPEAIPSLQAAVAAAVTLKSQTDLRFKLVRELLWSNRNAEALAVLAELRDLVARPGGAFKPDRAADLLAQIRELTVICHLRIAEQDNCVCSHNSDSCLFPIRGEGVHAQRQGALDAAAALREILAANPGDLAARWLMNLISMTLGEYPDKTPEAWLIPSRVFAGDSDISPFRNTAKERGVAALGHAGGCIVEDFDGDNRLDILRSSKSLEEDLTYFWNRGDGTFDDRTAAAGLTGQAGGVNLAHADFNNDGWADVLVLRGGWLGGSAYPHSLLRNESGKQFVDVTREAGMLECHPGQTGAWADFDNDGWVDLLIGHEADSGGEHRPFLYRNESGERFREIGAASGLSDLGSVRGAAWGDFDNDGWADLYLSRPGKTNVLLRNEPASGAAAVATRHFRDVTDTARVAEPIFSHAAWFFDFDNDGWLDIFAAGHKPGSMHDVAALYLGEPHSSETPRLYRNRRDGTFANVTADARLNRALFVLGANFGDVDNDGYQDLYLGTGSHDLRTLLPNRMFRNASGKAFEDVTTPARVGHVQKGSAVAFGDIDGDGDQDIYAVLGGWYTGDAFRSALFENPGHGNHWITLRLRGTKSNRAAIGARIKLVLTEGESTREVHACAGTGGSFGGSSLDQELGIGKASTIDAIEITWPATGSRQVLRNVAADRVVEIREE